MIFSYSKNKYRTRIKIFFPPKVGLLKELNMNNEVKEVKSLQSFVHLGELLRLEREKQGLSIEDVAKIKDWSPRKVRHIEEGRVNLINVVALVAEVLKHNIVITSKHD